MEGDKTMMFEQMVDLPPAHMYHDIKNMSKTYPLRSMHVEPINYRKNRFYVLIWGRATPSPSSATSLLTRRMLMGNQCLAYNVYSFIPNVPNSWAQMLSIAELLHPVGFEPLFELESSYHPVYCYTYYSMLM